MSEICSQLIAKNKKFYLTFSYYSDIFLQITKTFSLILECVR